MRLRRLELVIIAVTLAFICFTGGYLTGRSSGSLSISPSVVVGDGTSLAIEPPVSGATVSAPQPAPLPEQHLPLPPEVAVHPGVIEMPESPGYEPPPTPPPAPTVSARDSFGRLNINIASRTELMELPGIGPSLSERIVEHRSLNGPFRRIEDIRNVSGIGQQRFETIRDRITVG